MCIPDRDAGVGRPGSSVLSRPSPASGWCALLTTSPAKRPSLTACSVLKPCVYPREKREQLRQLGHGRLTASPTRWQNTPEDTFGSAVEGRHCVTASNIAKCDELHGLVIFNNSHPLNWGREEVSDYIETAWQLGAEGPLAYPSEQILFLLLELPVALRGLHQPRARPDDVKPGESLFAHRISCARPLSLTVVNTSPTISTTSSRFTSSLGTRPLTETASGC